MFTKQKVCKIMVVEDNPKTQETLRRMLETQESDIIIVGTGEEAKKMLLSGKFPNVLLLDLNLPLMSGSDLLEEMPSIPGAAKVPVITFSSTLQEGTNRPYEKDIDVVEKYLKAKEVAQQAANMKVTDIIPKYRGQEGVDVVHPRVIVEVAKELLHQDFELSPSFQHLLYISKKQIEDIEAKKR